MPLATPGIHPIHFRVFATEVLRLYRAPMRRKGTKDKTRQVLEEFGTFCRLTSDLTVEAITDWVCAHPDRRAATVDGLLRHLSAICTYGAFRGYMIDPFEFRPVSEWLPEDELDAEEFRHHRSAGEVRRVLVQADREALDGSWRPCRLRAAVYCWAFTGAGKVEVLGMRRRDVDLEAGVIWIRSHARRRLKARARSSPLAAAPELLEVLRWWTAMTEADGCEWLFPHRYRTGPWTSGRPGHRPLDEVKALGGRAGVHGLTILAFRHTVGTLAEGWGIGELMLQRLLRHARRRTQDHYRHADIDQMRAAAGKIHF